MGLFRRRSAEEPVDPEARSPQLGLKYKDLAVLAQLQKAGARLDEPRHVVHYLYLPSREAAELAAADAEAGGFTTDVRDPLPQDPSSWVLVCERRDVVLDPDLVRDSTDRFEAIARDHAGEYDGWEASV